jgi:hypothetical protein
MRVSGEPLDPPTVPDPVADGSLDTSFGTGGKVTTDMGVGFGLDEVRGLVVQGSKLVAAGSTYTGRSWDSWLDPLPG